MSSLQVGKGTFGKLIGAHIGIPHISAGDLLRREVEQKSQLGLQIQPLLTEGSLIPDGLIAQVIDKELQAKCDGNTPGFILDGFPRTVEQAKLLESLTPIDVALHITLARWVIIEKLKGRLICSGCGQSFNSANIVEPPYRMPSLVQDRLTCAQGFEYCSEKGQLLRRNDDTDDVIEKRMENYDESIQPILQYYARHNKLKTFEVRSGIDDTMHIIDLLLSK